MPIRITYARPADEVDVLGTDLSPRDIIMSSREERRDLCLADIIRLIHHARPGETVSVFVHPDTDDQIFTVTLHSADAEPHHVIVCRCCGIITRSDDTPGYGCRHAATDRKRVTFIS